MMPRQSGFIRRAQGWWRWSARAVALACPLLLTGPAQAHEVLAAVREARSVVITLTYADGLPFAQEIFEAGPVDQVQPEFTGRTDAQGRAVIPSPAPGDWRLRAFADDGHGVDLRFRVDPSSATVTAPSARAESSWPRWALGWLGLSVLMAVFGVLQMWFRRPGRVCKRPRT